jgi:phosphate transport system substrate-binding protein
MVSSVGHAQVRLVGSDLLGAPFAAALSQFAEQNGLKVTRDLRGTRLGLEELGAGRADLGLFVLPPGETPPEDGLLVSRAIAFQPLVVVVPRRSPVTQLTYAQVRAIFAESSAPSLVVWGDVSGVAERLGRIAPFALAPEISLAVPLARRALFDGAPLHSTVKLVPDFAELSRGLLAAENTVALATAVPAAADSLRALALAASLTEPAFAPTAENLADGSYALRLPLYVTLRRSSAERLLPLLRFLLSESGAATLEAAHFQPLPRGARNQLVLEFEVLR